MSLKNIPYFNTIRFGIAYALGLFVAGVDLSISVRAGESLTGSALGGTMAYVLIALGIIIAARVGAPWLQAIGPRKTYLGAGFICILSGITTSYAAYASVSLLFYLGMFLIGIFMGLSNFHRLLVKDYSDAPSVWDTSLVLLSGVLGSILGPWLAGTVAASVDDFYKAYQMVVVAGALTLVVSFMLPVNSKQRRQESPETSNSADRATLYLGGVVGLLAYVTMTLIMTAIPLEAQRQGLGGQEISRLTEMHMVSMYLPIVIVPLFLARFSPRSVSAWSLGLGGVGALGVFLTDVSVGYAGLALLMIIAGVIWAFSYTAASNMVAASVFGKLHPTARGYVEMLPPIGMVLGSILAGVLLQYVGFVWVVVTFVVVSIVGVPLVLVMGRIGSTTSGRD